ncbi:MAG: gamma-glutamyltransferase, partial [Bacteroidota bacterium]
MRNFYIILLLITVFYFSCTNQSKEEKQITQGVIADSAMVVSAHPLASQVGVDILKAGGNAVDAAIAVNFALAVVYPTAGNIGGGGFMVVREKDGNSNTLDFREAAPAGSQRNMYLDENEEVVDGLSTRGHLAVGVPGAVDGMIKAYEKYGSLPWQDLVQPAIDLAKNGFTLTEKEANGLNQNQENFEKYSTVKPEFILNEWVKGDTIQWLGLGAALERIRDKGRDGFYAGQTAKDIVEEMQRGSGLISFEDLQNYQSIWRDPVKIKYRGYDIVSMP